MDIHIRLRKIQQNILVLSALLLMFSCSRASEKVIVPNKNNIGSTSQEISVVMDIAGRPVPSLTRVEQNVRNAAVKVKTDSGHGSGIYMVFHGFHIILTAAHVVDDPNVTNYIIEGNGESVSAKVLYIDQRIDVAALLLDSEMSTRAPIRFRYVKNISRVGTRLIYSGYPSSHSLLTMRGMVAGYATNEGNTVILMHSFGWFGCSGSGVFDESGNFVGILWGIEVDGAYGMPQLIEDILWITPSNQIEYESILKSICLIDSSSFKCRKHRDKNIEE